MSEANEEVTLFEVQPSGQTGINSAAGIPPLLGIIRLATVPTFSIATIVALSSEVKLSVKPTSVTNEFKWTYTGPLSASALATYFGTGKTVKVES
ncbi:hypothetical protein HV213_13905 [Klebsiella sp. RHBSTW-00484]|uniref:hypothetical protein n=1 Tax=unclassified Klebsiella TaxID=2608929 RepID=UPI0015E5247C|nr:MULTISPECIES: hypothetical protein [unclassified Klebsiella]MBA7847276.1 hypothetical protein [Klebsiella sp. RHBSTW-00465]QLO36838.1 hypothetical protein HV213_13905 [Klebsiella sp. RHBSTW-00484]QLT76356.1 hypothetical protein HV204_13905 [Klebsiella sp. RHBSTW-00464]